MVTGSHTAAVFNSTVNDQAWHQLKTATCTEAMGADKILQTKSFFFPIVKNAPRVLPACTKAEKSKDEIVKKFVLVLWLSSGITQDR